MKRIKQATTNILLTLPCDLNERIKREAESQNRKRHPQIIYILRKFFETASASAAAAGKEKTK